MAGDHIVAVANFFGPRSGGLRTAMLALGRAYRALGYRHSYLVPGARDEVVETDAGTMYTVAAPLLPASGGYRVITRVAAVTELLAALRPDRVELSDRTTLHSVTRWSAERGVGSVFVAHERLDGVFAQAGVPQPIAHRLVDRRNRATAAHASAIVATTDYAAAEFDRIGCRSAWTWTGSGQSSDLAASESAWCSALGSRRRSAVISLSIPCVSCAVEVWTPP